MRNVRGGLLAVAERRILVSKFMRYLIVVSLVSAACFGQSAGAISGVVHDPFGGLQKDATVQAKNVQTGTLV